MRSLALSRISAALLLVLVAPAEAQTWARQLEGPLVDVAAASDGGWIAAGFVSRVTQAGTLFKLGPAGDLEWAVELDGPGADAFESVTEVPDGFVAAGLTDSFGPVATGWVVKVDRSGNLAWQRAFLAPEAVAWYWVLALPDGGVAVGGMRRAASLSEPDYLVVKLDASGAVAWATGYRRTLGDGSGGAGGESDAVLDAAGNIVFASIVTRSATFFDVDFDGLLVVMDQDGSVVRQRGCGLPAFDEWIVSLAPTRDGGFHALAYVRGDAPYDAALLRLGIDGDVEWQRSMGKEGLVSSDGFALVAAPDDGVVAVGRDVDLAEQRGWIMRFDPAGDLAWQEGLDSAVLDATSAPGGFVATTAQGLIARMDEQGGCRSSCVAVTTPGHVVVERLPEAWVVDHPWNAQPVSSFPTSATPLTMSPPSSCSSLPCLPLTCDGIVVEPPSPCAAAPASLTLVHAGGEMPQVSWDVDGDGQFELDGNPVTVSLPVGTTTVTARAVDACPTGVQECTTSVDVEVTTSSLPPEVSDVTAGAPPLRVVSGSARVPVSAARVSGVFTYRARVGVLGDFVSSTPSCDVPWTDRGDGTVALSVGIPAGSWLVVTAANACGEGPSGRTSMGIERSDRPGWSTCP